MNWTETEEPMKMFVKKHTIWFICGIYNIICNILSVFQISPYHLIASFTILKALASAFPLSLPFSLPLCVFINAFISSGDIILFIFHSASLLCSPTGGLCLYRVAKLSGAYRRLSSKEPLLG